MPLTNIFFTVVKKVEIRPDYIYFSVSGSFKLAEEAAEVIREVKELSDNHHVFKIVLDITQMNRTPIVRDRFELGEYAAKIWGHQLKVAIVNKPSNITGFFENVAVNRGADIRVLPTLAQAEAWLKE